jgi:hypothetical protein
MFQLADYYGVTVDYLLDRVSDNKFFPKIASIAIRSIRTANRYYVRNYR